MLGVALEILNNRYLRNINKHLNAKFGGSMTYIYRDHRVHTDRARNLWLLVLLSARLYPEVTWSW